MYTATGVRIEIIKTEQDVLREQLKSLRASIILNQKAIQRYNEEIAAVLKKIVRRTERCQACLGTGKVPYGEGYTNCGRCVAGKWVVPEEGL